MERILSVDELREFRQAILEEQSQVAEDHRVMMLMDGGVVLGLVNTAISAAEAFWRVVDEGREPVGLGTRVDVVDGCGRGGMTGDEQGHTLTGTDGDGVNRSGQQADWVGVSRTRRGRVQFGARWTYGG